MGIEEKTDSFKGMEKEEVKESLKYFLKKAEESVSNYVKPVWTNEDEKKWYDAIKTPFNI